MGCVLLVGPKIHTNTYAMKKLHQQLKAHKVHIIFKKIDMYRERRDSFDKYVHTKSQPDRQKGSYIICDLQTHISFSLVKKMNSKISRNPVSV